MLPAQLETPRLLLRQFVADDLPALAAIRAMPEVARHLAGPPTREYAHAIAEMLIAKFTADWRDRGYGAWAIERRQDALFCGHCGLRFVPELNAVDLLYMLHPAAWGQGLAQEAARAALAAGFAAGLERIVAVTRPDNAPSRRLLERLGFADAGLITYKQAETAYYVLDAASWAPFWED